MDGNKKTLRPEHDAVQRKEDHIDLVLAQRTVAHIPDFNGQAVSRHCFDAVKLTHVAMPEIAFEDIDLTAEFLGHTLSLPCMISSMTGGPTRAEIINAHLAEAAAELNIAMGVGSQRVALEAGADAGLARSIRQRAPHIPLFANLGAVQLTGSLGLDGAKRAVDMLEANGLILHFNPLQELLQPGGDRDWRGILHQVEKLVRCLDVPILAKEVGFGISGDVAQRLTDAGVSAIDVAGCGGTDFASVELARNDDPMAKELGTALEGWGLDTVTCLNQIRDRGLPCDLVASGGVRHGVDAAKALALGATIIAQAGPVLRSALASTDAVLAHFRSFEHTLRAACLLTGSPTLAALPHALRTN